jgi:hypothetical protein
MIKISKKELWWTLEKVLMFWMATNKQKISMHRPYINAGKHTGAPSCKIVELYISRD